MIRRRSGAASGDRINDAQRTTLSFLLATIAVATGAFVGLGQAAASATTADSIRADEGASAPHAVELDPAHPALRVDAPAVASENLLVALGQLERLPEPVDSPPPVSVPTTMATSIESSDSGGDPSPSLVAPVEQSSTTTSTTVAPAPPDTMAIREWRPISAASFRRFVEARNFTTTDYLTSGLVHGTIVQDDQSINVVLVHRSATSPMRVSPGDRGREPVGEWARSIGATAGINANWYNPFDGPAVSGGWIYGGSDHGYTALFGFTADGDLVADHHHKIHDRVDPRVVEAVSGHPTLIHRGTPSTDFGSDPTFTGRNPRTAIGVSGTVDVLILVTVDGRRGAAVGMTGAETTRLLERLGAHDAVMLDGGGSSAMWIAGKGIVNRQSEPGRAVGNQIAVFGS
ncbi:MAG: phosphodiester glycosidase family protein [Acidimicrobiia bacterium]|nr:phosphodiester glycosidase family protein [Acidimicrobiia bacterium]